VPKFDPAQFFAFLPDQFWTWLNLGGPVALVLLVLSIIALAIILIKFLQFTLLPYKGRRAVRIGLELWSTGHYDEATEALRRTSARTPKLLRHAMRLLRRHGTDTELVREEVTRLANRLVQKQRSYLRTLEVSRRFKSLNWAAHKLIPPCCRVEFGQRC